MKRTIQKLPESELDIMLVLWKQKSGMSRSEIEKIVNQKKTLAPTTILTLLSRLVKKGFVSIKRVGNLNKYHWLVSQEEYQQKEGKGKQSRCFGKHVSSGKYCTVQETGNTNAIGISDTGSGMAGNCSSVWLV